jgi:1-acyl-sn-glycerol-3-phosphate acyltransferase
MQKFAAVLKLAAFALNCLWVIPTQSLVLFITKGPASYYLPQLWHRALCFFFGIRWEIEGEPCTDRQVLYMSNHLSYLDIPMIASILRASFVAKSEVEGWALFGYLSTLQQTAFIQRKRSAIAREKKALQDRINEGESLIIFPEGTSTSGLEVLPFKSSLFALALGEDKPDLYIQPITIQLLEIDGHPPRSKEEQDLYAWPRDVDIDLHVHLWRFALTSGAKLRLTFHSPLRARDFADRKVLAKTCHDNVSKGLSLAFAA